MDKQLYVFGVVQDRDVNTMSWQLEHNPLGLQHM